MKFCENRGGLAHDPFLLLLDKRRRPRISREIHEFREGV